MRKIIIFVGLLTIFLSSAIFAFAQGPGKALMVIPRNATIDEDFLKAGERIQIFGTLKRDAYLAGGDVIIDGTIEGDLLVSGGNIVISGQLKQDVRVLGGDIQINGAKIDGNVTVVGGNVTIDKTSSIAGSVVGAAGRLETQGSIGRNITAFGGEVIIGGNVKDDLSISAGELSILSGATISGQLQYWSEVQADISNEASISGSISKFSFQEQNTEQISQQFDGAIKGFLLILKFVDLVMLLAVGLLFMIFLPNYSNRLATTIRKGFWNTFIVGLIFSLVTPIVAILLIITILGLPLGITLLFVFAFTLWIGKIFGILYLGTTVQTKLNNKSPLAKRYTIGLIFFMILSLIPIIDLITGIIITSIGVGTLLISKKQYYQELRSKEVI